MEIEKNNAPAKIVKAVTKLKVELIRLLDSKYITHDFSVSINTSRYLSNITELLSEVEGMLKQENPKKSETAWKQLKKCPLSLDLMEIVVKMDDVAKLIQESSSSQALEETIDYYLTLLDLAYSLRNRADEFAADLECFTCIDAIIQYTDFSFLSTMHRILNILTQNVSITRQHNGAKLTLRKNNLTVSEATWNKAVMCWEKVGRLHIYMDSFFKDLMTYFIEPLSESGQLHICEVKDHELTFKTDVNSNALYDPDGKVMQLRTIINFLFSNMPSLTQNAGFSLVEKLGETKRGFRLFQHVIGRLLSNHKNDVNPVLFYGLMEEIAKEARNNGFIDGSEKRKLLELISKHASNSDAGLISQAGDLIKSNFHNTVLVGCKSKSRITKPNPGIFKSEDCLDSLVFPECSISKPVYQLVELIYESMAVVEVAKKEPKTSDTTANIDSTTTRNITMADLTIYEKGMKTANITSNTTLCNDTTLNNNNNTTMNNNNQTTPLSLIISSSISSSDKVFKMRMGTVNDVSKCYLEVCNVAQLFADCRLPLHEKEVEGNAYLSAVHHNDCKWLAHHLFLIQRIMNSSLDTKVSKRKKKASKDTKSQDSKCSEATVPPVKYSFLKWVVSLENGAKSTISRYVAMEKSKMTKSLEAAFEEFKEQRELGRLRGGLKGCFERLQGTKKAWEDVLDAEHLARQMGDFLEHIISATLTYFIAVFNEELNKQKDGKKYMQLLKAQKEVIAKIQNFGTSLFLNLPSSPAVLAPSWAKLPRILFLCDPLTSYQTVVLDWGLDDDKTNNDDEEVKVIRGLFTLREIHTLYSLAFPTSPMPSLLSAIKFPSSAN